ncbi:hypothetical protein ABT189_00115 [Streptomyces sp900105755]|uniref:hypothetical protein n=1 Tax=Streptomyces sp. 900105755 TaxID=3154389 RepID=UPI00331FE7B2
MNQRNASAKAGIVDVLIRRGLTRVDALALADKLSTTPADHRAARAEISNVLELRTV